MGATQDARATVEIGGDTVPIPPASAAIEPVTWDGTMECSKAGTIDGPWTGIPLAALLEAADLPATTTHLRVHCRDGLVVCLGLREALDAVLAYARDDTLLTPDTVRIVGPGIDSTRSARGVERLEPLALDPGEDTRDYEDLHPDGE